MVRKDEPGQRRRLLSLRPAVQALGRLSPRRRTALTGALLLLAVLIGLSSYQRLVWQNDAPPNSVSSGNQDSLSMQAGKLAFDVSAPPLPAPQGGLDLVDEPVGGPAVDAPGSQTETAPAPDSAPGALAPSRFTWPVDGEVVTAFGWRRSDAYGDFRLQRGIDIRAALGQPVRAGAAGLVTRVETTGDYGLVVEIDHDAELTTVYAGLDAPQVTVGQRVRTAQVIARLGVAGAARAYRGPHLHFAIRQHGEYVDPLLYLETGP